MKKIIKILIVICSMHFTFLSLMSEILLAQSVAINTTGAAPNASALLDVDASPGNNKGILIPRISLTSTTDVITIANPATSLLVYNINAAMTGGGVGFWYWNGTQWVQALGPAGPTGPTGAASTVPGPTGPTGANGATGPTGAASNVSVTNQTGSGSINGTIYTYSGSGTPLFLVVTFTSYGGGNCEGSLSVQWEDAASTVIRSFTKISGFNIGNGNDGGSGMNAQELSTIPFLPGSTQLRFQSNGCWNPSYTLIAIIDK